MRLARPALLLAASLLASCAGPTGRVREGAAYSPRVVFTSGVTDGDPIDSLGRADFDDEKLCLWVQWFDLDRDEHRYRSEIRDGAGELVYVGELALEAGDRVTWDCYHHVAAIDRPGLWEFRIEIDGRLRLERKILVVAE